MIFRISVLLSTFVVAVIGHAQAQSPLAAFAGLGPPATTLNYEGRYIPGGHRDPDLTENRLSFTAPAYRDAVHTVTPALTASRLSLGRSVRLSTNRPVPRELTRLEVGAQYSHQLERGRNWGIRTSIGYAGDQPLDTGEDLTATFAATYGFPGRSGYWVLMVLLSNNGALLNYVPIPGFLYVYRTPEFVGIFGLPILSLTWMPKPWTMSLSAFGPLVRAEIAVGAREAVQGFVEYALTQQFYIPLERERERERLNVAEERAALGLRFPIWSALAAELKAGLAFRRSISIGKGFGDRSGGKYVLADEGFVGAQATQTF